MVFNRIVKLVISFTIVIGFTLWHEASAKEEIAYYIDGQPQRYSGSITMIHNEYYVPLHPLVIRSEQWSQYVEEIRELGEYPSYVDFVEILEEQLDIEEVNGREMLALHNLDFFGYEYYLYESNNILHLSSQGLIEIAGIHVGMDKDEVEAVLGPVHWNTAFGQNADYIGFYGEMKDYYYTDRYRITRKGQVPDIQLEITDGKLSYIIVSSVEYPTSKGIRVGDPLGDVFREYGSSYVREDIDGKQVYIYDVEQGSIWFITNQERQVERIGYWNFWLAGFQ